MDTGKSKDQRKEIREHLIGDFLWSYYADTNGPGYERAIINVSSSGLSVITQRPTRSGDILKMYIDGLWEGDRYAVVKWCRNIAPDIYRIGLSLSDKTHPSL